VANDDELTRLLASIDRRLALLTAAQDRDLREALRTEVLRTPARIAMFESIDGTRGSGELAELGNVSGRAAQLFVKELLDLGLVRPAATSAGRTVIVERDESAIIDWYLQRNPDRS
jgi:hypothetical protein